MLRPTGLGKPVQLALIMALAIAGCGDNATSPAPVASQAAQSPAPAAPAKAVAEITLTKGLQGMFKMASCNAANVGGKYQLLLFGKAGDTPTTISISLPGVGGGSFQSTPAQYSKGVIVEVTNSAANQTWDNHANEAAGTVTLDASGKSGSVDSELVKFVTAGPSQAGNVHVSGTWTCGLT